MSFNSTHVENLFKRQSDALLFQHSPLCRLRHSWCRQRRVRFQFIVREEDVTKILLSGCGREEPRLPRNLRSGGRRRSPTGGGIEAMVTRRGVRIPVPERSTRRGGGGIGVDAGADDYQPPDPSVNSYDSMKDKLCTMHPFRVGGAASHSMDGVALDVLTEYMWSEVRNRRTQICMLIGVTVSVAAAGVKLSCETAFIKAAALPLSEQFTRLYAAFPWRNRSRAH